LVEFDRIVTVGSLTPYPIFILITLTYRANLSHFNGHRASQQMSQALSHSETIYQQKTKKQDQNKLLNGRLENRPIVIKNRAAVLSEITQRPVQPRGQFFFGHF